MTAFWFLCTHLWLCSALVRKVCFPRVRVTFSHREQQSEERDVEVGECMCEQAGDGPQERR